MSQQHNIRTFVVSPSLPENLRCLHDIAYNLWWTWTPEAMALFRRMDWDLWEETNHNPVKLLGSLSQHQLEQLSRDESFLAHMDRVRQRMAVYSSSPSWYQTNQLYPNEQGTSIAYFSAEFGLYECLPIYSGGLGILAGDHLKSASDLGLPLVGVGLLYRQGYFQQYLNADGWQQEFYPELDFYNMPVSLVMHEDGRPVRFHVRLASRDVVVQIWRVYVGRVTLYLLDTNLRCNRIEDRQITAQLYGGDNEMRIRQEVLLGIGGIRALETLNVRPTVCHMNEGHAAFLSLERARQIMEEHQLSFIQAREATISGNVFTTHTPVPAGHDVFSAELMQKYLGDYAKHLKVPWDTFLGLGRDNPTDTNAAFSMTNLALRMSSRRNGVSQLHGAVSREMCRDIWGQLPVDEVPITSITNGIHIDSWLSRDMSELYDRYLGRGWSDRPSSTRDFQLVQQIPDEELWRTHERRRERLVAFARRRLKNQLQRRNASPSEITVAEEVLDPEALTIGFARRFATYKRGTLLFRDIDRFARIISDRDRPVQIIFAGKAHPRDSEGKELIRQLVHAIRSETFRRRVVFLENYDINVARYLVQGVDIWLNTPRRGMEASGTSGMKVIANGGLNMSILDGWWCEGYMTDTGWAIGQGESYQDQAYQDDVESRALYDLLEKEVIPLFYKRSGDRLPRSWIHMMKRSIGKLSAHFSTGRMVAEYAQGFYMPSAHRYREFAETSMDRAKNLADWKESMRDRWNEISIGKVEVPSQGDLFVGSKMEVRAQVSLGSIDPSEVTIELYQGPIDADGHIQHGEPIIMDCKGQAADNSHIFVGHIRCRYSGLCGFALRVIATHPDLMDKYDTGLILWDDKHQAGESEPTPAPQEEASTK